LATAADVNGDGRPDLILANRINNTVSVLLNRTAPGAAAPAFAAPQPFTTGGGPISATAADVNGDGRPDLLVTNVDSDTVSVLLNITVPGAAAPAFAAQQPFATGTSPRSVTAADVNGDGTLDLIVANRNSNTVSVLLNTTPPGAATPAFAAQQPFTTGTSPGSVTAADVNGDGTPDLIVANESSNTVSVLLNITAPGAATPAFAAQSIFATGNFPRSVAAADVNGDGRPDLLVANGGGGTVSVLLNTTVPGAATPAFAALQTFATGAAPISVTAADVNGDGRPDLIVASSTEGRVSVLLNTTAPGAMVPSFAPRQAFDTGGIPSSATAADVNGDGRPDLIVANRAVVGSDNGTVSVLLNTTAPGAATAAFTSEQSFATGNRSWSVTAADVNGDGRPDLLVANLFGNTISVLRNTTAPGAATPAFAAQQTFATGSLPHSVTTADVNGDGTPDLLVANPDGNTVSVLLNARYRVTLAGSPATGTIQSAPAVGLNPGGLSFGDVLVGQPTAAQTVTLTNTGGADLILGTLTLSGAAAGDFALGNDTCSNQTVVSAATCAFEISFTPSATGARAGQVDILSNAPSSPDAVGLAGTGVQAAVDVVPGALDFGDVLVGQPTAAQTVTLTNTGGADLILGALALSGAAAGDYALGNDTCSNQTVAPAASCTFEIGFTPSATGARAGQVDIPSNAPSSPDAVGLAGTGVEAVVDAAPGALDFGEVVVGQPATPQTVTLTNTGTADLILGTLALSGAAAGDYALGNDSCSNQAVVPAASCTFEVGFTPSATGARAGQVDIPSNASTSLDVVTLTGNGVQGALTMTPDPVDFGTQGVGTTSAAMSTTLQNTGSAVVNVTSVSAPGAPFQAAGGTCGTAPFAIDPSASCTLDFTFSPIAVGIFDGTISVANDAPSSPDSFGLQGAGVASEVLLSANPFDFGVVALGEAATGLILLTNTGNQDLEVSDVTDPGEPFALGFGAAIGGPALCPPPPFTLTLDQSCALEVLFDPTSSGMSSATFDIISNAPTSPDNVTLLGAGGEPPILEVPTLSSWGLALLAGALGLFGWLALRRVSACWPS
jgi:hypothetical protein